MLKSVRVVSTGGQAKNDLLPLGNAGILPFFITNIDGLEPVKNTLNFTGSVYKPGNYFNSSHAEPRNLVLAIGMNPVSSYTYNFEEMRSRIYTIFQPAIPVVLEFVSDKFPDGVRIMGYVEDISPSIFTEKPEVQVSMVCPDPYFSDKNPTTLNLPTDYVDLTKYLGTAPTPYKLTKTISADVNTPITFGVMNGAEVTLSGGFKAGDVFTLNTDPNRRELYVTRNGTRVDMYNYIHSGTMISMLSSTLDHIYVNAGSMNGQLSSGLTIEFNRRWLGL